MKYFLDTEFIEGPKPARFLGMKMPFVKPVDTIQLISIGIVGDGRKYYAISNEFEPRDASDWVRENVLKPMLMEYFQSYRDIDKEEVEQYVNGIDIVKATREMQRFRGKSNKQITHEIFEFVNPQYVEGVADYSKINDGFFSKSHNIKVFDNTPDGLRWLAQPEFWAYYADYDWVVFCWLFGRMIDLPNGFPMYCRDLKQRMDVLISDYSARHGVSIKSASEMLRGSSYPKVKVEHHALYDAMWEAELDNYLLGFELYVL